MESTNALGATPLHVAAGYDHLSVVKWLVEQGVDINAKDNEGSTPLDWAGEEASVYLEELGAEWGEWEEEDESETESIEVS